MNKNRNLIGYCQISIYQYKEYFFLYFSYLTFSLLNKNKSGNTMVILFDLFT